LKIVVTAGGIIWNESHPALQKYGSDVIIVRRTPDAGAELVARVGADRNVLVLTDNDPRSFLPLTTLTRSFQSRRIHLFVCLPFTYESSRRKQEILELLSDFSKVKTLCLVELDTFLNGMGKDETLGGLQLRIRNGMIDLIDRAVAAMDGLDDFARYRYDLEADVYREYDFSTLGDEFCAKLLKKRGSVTTKEAAAVEENTAVENDVQPELTEAGTENETADNDSAAEIRNERSEVPVEEVPATEPAAEAPAEPEQPAKKKRRSLFAFLSRRKD